MELEPTSSQEEHNLYHCISLSRGQIHRVIIRSNDPGAVLTWDFDVMRHNIIFTVLYQAYNDDKDLSLGMYTYMYMNKIQTNYKLERFDFDPLQQLLLKLLLKLLLLKYLLYNVLASEYF